MNVFLCDAEVSGRRLNMLLSSIRINSVSSTSGLSASSATWYGRALPLTVG